MDKVFIEKLLAKYGIENIIDLSDCTVFKWEENRKLVDGYGLEKVVIGSILYLELITKEGVKITIERNV